MSECIDADKQKPRTIMSKGFAGMWCSAWHWWFSSGLGVLFPQDLPIVWSIRNFRLHPQQANKSQGKSSSKWGVPSWESQNWLHLFRIPTYSNHEFWGQQLSAAVETWWHVVNDDGNGLHHQCWLSGGPEETYQNQALELWYEFLFGNSIPICWANQERSDKMLDSWINAEHLYKKTYCQIAYSFEIHWRNPTTSINAFSPTVA